MSKPQTISQKRWIKGVNAGTGILTQPPNTVSRISNLLFTQRGSLQTTSGSAIIGQLVSPFSGASAIGVFDNFISGQYPYYPAITDPNGYELPNVTLNSYGVTAGSTNLNGSYAFAVVATLGSLHSDPNGSSFALMPPTVFGGITFNMQVLFGNFYYFNGATISLYYLPGGIGSTQGVLVDSFLVNLFLDGFPPNISFTFTGAIPTTPLVNLPIGNNSYSYGVQIGYLAYPNLQVLFAQTAISFPAQLPQPAQIAPGTPGFAFQSPISGTTPGQTYTGPTGTETAVQSGPGATTNTSPALTGFPAITVSSGSNVSASVTVTAQISVGLSGYGQIAFQYSPNSGANWYTFYQQTAGVTTTYGPTTIPITMSGISNLSNIEFQIIAFATASGSAITTTVGSITASSVIGAATSTVSTFTPYGGIPGFCGPIPQILQFNSVSILILGNAYPPQSINPANLATTVATALANTFQATYPTWQASVAWIVGDNIAVLIGGTNYVFNATQGGTSQATIPTFPSTLGATVFDGQVVWKNTGALTTSAPPRGAAHGIAYAGSLWLFNTYPQTTADQNDGPCCLKMSDSNNQNSWNPANVAFLGKDDGTQGTGMASFTIAEVGIAPTQSLVCFKEFSTFQILGVFGATDFQITQAETNLGCIASRSIQFLTGYGIVRLTHMGFAIFDGVKDRVISEEIRPYIYGGIQSQGDITGIDFTYCYISKSSQTSLPPMYVCACPLAGANGALTRLFIYDLVLKAWTIINLPWPISCMIQASTGEGNPLTIGVRADGTGYLERFFAGDLSWDASTLISGGTPAQTAITWSFTTVHVYENGSSSRGFYRSVVIRGAATSSVSFQITVSVRIDGNPGVTYQGYVYPQPGSNQFQIDVDLLFTGQIANMNVTGTGLVTIDGVDWEVSKKPGGRLMIG
jgi:hypothetical protein